MSIGARFRLFVEENFSSISSFTYVIQISNGLLHKYFNDDTAPGAGVLQKLYDLGCNINWLLSGHGEMWNDTEAGRTLRDKHSKKTVTADDNRKKK
ncbi:MAG: hypothetical protein JNL36_07800 [Candidatus Kapabacteria bacterium]|nr:hypothetical protein [Candidatus Kapabacteria bacterium]